MGIMRGPFVNRVVAGVLELPLSQGVRYSPREMIEKLVGFPTVSRDSNLELIGFVQEYLRGHGVQARLVASDDGRKANLFATVGPNRPGGVVLSGHTDVVPIDDQTWRTDPFCAVERDGRIYGRGTCDMKSFLAIGLALVPEMHTLTAPIHFALSYDEEIGCLGAPRMIARLRDEVPPVRAVVVGEPTSMKVVTGHKSILHFDTRLTGHEAHSSQPHRGVSAVMAAGRLLHWLDDRQRQNAAAADADCPFEPAYTTLHCGVIHGGTAHNIMAGHCHFVTDVRALPQEDPRSYLSEFQTFASQTVEADMRRVHSECRIAIEVCANVPGFVTSEDEPAVQLAKQLTGQNGSCVQAYAAEAGQFQQAGFSVVMCGPGSIDQAHQPDEYIDLAQVTLGERFVRNLIAVLS